MPDPLNGRLDTDLAGITALAVTIRSNGLLNPVTVRPHGAAYELIAGCRRLQAVTQLGWHTIPAIVRHDDDHSADSARLVENLARLNLTPIEEARQLDMLVEDNPAGVDGVADLTGHTANYILNRLDLLRYPTELQAYIHTGQIGLGAASHLARVANTDRRLELIHHAAAHGITTATAELWLREANRPEPNYAEMSQKGSQDGPETQQYKTLATCFVCRSDHDIFQTRPVRVCEACLAEIAGAARNLSAPEHLRQPGQI